MYQRVPCERTEERIGAVVQESGKAFVRGGKLASGNMVAERLLFYDSSVSLGVVEGETRAFSGLSSLKDSHRSRFGEALS